MTLTSLADLTRAGLIAPEEAPDLAPVADLFRIRLTPGMADLAGEPGVAAQFVPTLAEAVIREQERHDPIGDHRFSPAPGVTHRYPDRVILAVTQACDV